jgi:hypothetical protein
MDISEKKNSSKKITQITSLSWNLKNPMRELIYASAMAKKYKIS